jgi:hypothetical protein
MLILAFREDNFHQAAELNGAAVRRRPATRVATITDQPPADDQVGPE